MPGTEDVGCEVGAEVVIGVACSVCGAGRIVDDYAKYAKVGHWVGGRVLGIPGGVPVSDGE